jgi:outer membrane protein assembly factor BamB
MSKKMAYKSSISNQPQSFHNKFVAGSGVGAKPIQIRRIAATKANQYLPPDDEAHQQFGAIWPSVTGFDGRNVLTTIYDAPAVLPDVSVRNLFTDVYDVLTFAPVIASDGTMYQTYGYLNELDPSLESFELFAFNREGVILWHRIVETDRLVFFGDVININIGTNGELYLPCPTKFLCLYPNGNTKWELNIDGLSFYVSAFCNGGIVVNMEIKIVFVDVNGNVKWIFALDMGDIQLSGNMLVDSKGNIYIQTRRTTVVPAKTVLYKLNSFGQLIWKVVTPGINRNIILMSKDESTLFIDYFVSPSSTQSFVYAYSTDSGQPIWATGFNVASRRFQFFIIDHNDNIYVTSGSNRAIYVFNWRTFDPISNPLPTKTIILPYPISIDLLLTNNNNLIVCGTDTENIMISSIDINADEGNEIQWTQTVCEDIDGSYITTRPVVDSNGKIYLSVTSSDIFESRIYSFSAPSL